jgi:hypothetical protein
VNAYPLTWPAGFPRAERRLGGGFKTSLAGALDNVETSLRLFSSDSGKKIEGLVISSNVTLGQQRPPDPGVAAWFVWDGIQVCIPIDRYDKVEANLQAIHHVIEARRTELRHGGLAIVRATFTGFRALPAPTSMKPWREVLGLQSSEEGHKVIESAYRRLRSQHHPDKGGDAEKFRAVQVAYDEAKREVPS